MPEPTVVSLLWKHVLYLLEGSAPHHLGGEQEVYIPSWHRTAGWVLYHPRGVFPMKSLCEKCRRVQCTTSEILVTNQFTLGSVVTSGEGYGCSRASVPTWLPQRVATEPGQSDFVSNPYDKGDNLIIRYDVPLSSGMIVPLYKPRSNFFWAPP